MGTMKNFLWGLLLLGITCLGLWIVTSPGIPNTRVAMVLEVAFFVTSGLGGTWMLYTAIRYEKHPFSFILLACIPYFFLWYYFERVRPIHYKTREANKSGRSVSF